VRFAQVSALRGPRFRITRSEISGAFADLGLLLPLEAALIAVNGLNPTSTLLGAGIIYIAAGWFFGLPMPVQPLKALAAIAVAEELSPDVIAAGALLMSLSLGVLAVTGLIDRLYTLVPPPVVRGIQLGLAYVLIRGAISLMSKPLAAEQAVPSVALGDASIPIMVALAPVAVLVVLLLLKKPLVPASVAVLAAGVAAGLYLGRWHGIPTFGPAPLSMSVPDSQAFSTGAVVLLTAQLPLTLANSVIATSDAARHYFPQATRATPRNLSLSIALSNMWAGLFGGLPTCHGSGGLTAHYRFGARTPVATTLLGVTLVAVAVLFGGAAQSIRTLVPLPFFGILLLVVGIQHIFLAASVERRSDLAFVALAGALAIVFDGNLAYAAALTLTAFWAVQGLRRLVPSMAPPLAPS
jgi:MFS superfamily sulfate permease-like transporter